MIKPPSVDLGVNKQLLENAHERNPSLHPHTKQKTNLTTREKMDNFSYIFLWVILTLQLIGIGVTASKIGEPRPAYTGLNLFTAIVMSILVGLSVYLFPR